MEREAFLNRIAGALGRDTVATTPPNPITRGVPEFYFDMAKHASAAERADRFARELEAVGGQVIRVDGVDGAAKALAGLLRGAHEAGPISMLTWDRSEFKGWDIDDLWSEIDAPENPLDAAFGLTTVDAAVAVTGTIVLSTSPTRPRCASLTVTTHIALVHVNQIVDRLGEAFELITARGPMPSGLYCITGPSRSADIENDLTIGVHGPAAVIVILAG